MNNYFSNWINQPWNGANVSPYDLIEQKPTAVSSTKFLDAIFSGKDEDLNDDEADYMFRELKTLTVPQLVNKIRDIHNMAYELGVNEGIEMARARFLNIFDEEFVNN